MKRFCYYLFICSYLLVLLILLKAFFFDLMVYYENFICYYGLGVGWCQKVVCDLADQMSNLGHRVIVAYLTGEILVRPKNLNIDISIFDLNNLSQLYSSSRRYRKLIQDFQPDIVHAHMVHANIFRV